MTKFIIQNLVFVLVGVFFATSSNAKVITQQDIRQYMLDPIFDNLWFGIYDRDNRKYGWWNAKEYREGRYCIFEDRTEIKLLDRVEVGTEPYDEQTIGRGHQ